MYLAGRNARRWLVSRDLTRVAAVIANGGYSPLMLRLLPLLRGRGIPLVVDIADWYDPWHQPGGPFTPFVWQIEFAMRYLHKRCDGVITVSSFLKRYYEAATRMTVRIPPTTDTGRQKWLKALSIAPQDANELRLAYAGTPGRKDDICTVLEAVRRARALAGPISLTIVGPSRDAIRATLPEDLRTELEGTNVNCPGYVPHEEVPQLLAERDFSILMRPRKRYAEAGFPTKLVESLCSGVPMIVNATSDIGEYVHDGQEGFIVPEYSTDALVATLVRAAKTPFERRREMRRAARARAIADFDNQAYSRLLASMIAGLNERSAAKVENVGL
jgi:glycosyltransferase involved in cell wall biosynthesis